MTTDVTVIDVDVAAGQWLGLWRPADAQPLPAAGRLAYEISREVLDDIAAGTVPASVRSYSALHDYVDANCYGGLCDDGKHDSEDCDGPDCSGTAHVDLAVINAAMDIVDAWLRFERPESTGAAR